MSAWGPKKVAAFKTEFQNFLKIVRIDSKETGARSELRLYTAQRRFLQGIFSGLEDDIHSFTVLKSRQLGMTTISILLDLFWVGVHDGLQGGIVFDTDQNKEKARLLINRCMESLHDNPGFNFPKKVRDYRGGFVFDNGSSLDLLVAGIKKSRTTGGLGRSRAFNFLHATECSSWADQEGLTSLQEALAEEFPNRLYIWESTARGLNIFYDMWRAAKADDLRQRAIFIGWWAKDTQRISEGTPAYVRYGEAPPNDEEQEKIDLVKRLYDFEVSREQLAWIRRKVDPTNDPSLEDPLEGEINDVLQQEQPWTEDEAFILTGSSFFSADKLTEAMKQAKTLHVKGFAYYMNNEFLETVVDAIPNPKKAWLKVWEEPDPQGLYAIGCDPAYGSSDDSFNHCAQVLRCYADGVDQVAEFCTSEPDTSQFAWVITHLCGAYGGMEGGARLLLELNGPGHAVWTEIRALKKLLEMGYLRTTAEEKGLTNIFRHVRDYIWAKADMIQRTPSAFHWETTSKRKVETMERLRGLFNVDAVRIRSIECLKEMEKVVREGDTIKGEGSAKYDRVMALAIAIRAWEDGERPKLIRDQRTRENEAKRKTLSIADLQQIFSTGLVQGFFQQQQYDRRMRERAARRGRRWQW